MLGLNKKKLRPQYFGGPVLENWLHLANTGPGHNALDMYLERLEDIMINSLEELSSMKHPIEFLNEMKKVSFKIIVNVFMGSSSENIIKKIGSLFTDLCNGMLSIPLNAPGFTFHKALKVIFT
jgi:ent-kaurenoic acid hydroxylase